MTDDITIAQVQITLAQYDTLTTIDHDIISAIDRLLSQHLVVTAASVQTMQRARNERILADYADGSYSVDGLAKRYGISRQSVYSVINSASNDSVSARRSVTITERNAQIRADYARDADVSMSSLADRYNLSLSSIIKIVRD